MKIFMVDDDVSAMMPTLDLLQGVAKYDVTKVGSVREAREEFGKAQAGGEWPYDLLILDVHIQPEKGHEGPVGDIFRAGLDLYQEFRSMFKYQKVLILTNLFYRVPAELRDGPYTIARDKVAVAGNRLLEAINEFVHPGWSGD